MGIDSLMAVATAEHSADNSKFRQAFPSLAPQEESVYECFARIRKLGGVDTTEARHCCGGNGQLLDVLSRQKTW